LKCIKTTFDFISQIKLSFELSFPLIKTRGRRECAVGDREDDD